VDVGPKLDFGEGPELGTLTVVRLRTQNSHDSPCERNHLVGRWAVLYQNIFKRCRVH
jgi:hypothetical protein